MPEISYDGPLYEGDYMVLQAKGADANTYIWQGPNGESHVGKYWEVGVVQRINQGRYVVTVEDDVCDGITNYADIIVYPLELPCVLQGPVVELSSSAVNSFQIVDIQGRIDSNIVNDPFVVKITGVEGIITIVFPTSDFPYYDRSYGVPGNPTYSQADLVNIVVEINGNFYSAKTNGFLYVRDNGNYTFDAILCNLQLYGEAEIINLSMRITCVPE